MSNKNKSGIDNFLNHQKLFSREKVSYNKILTGYKVGDALEGARGTTSKGHHYHLLPEGLKDSRYEKNSPIQNRDSAEIAEYADNYNNRSMNKSNANAANTHIYTTPSLQSKSQTRQSRNSAYSPNATQKLTTPDQNVPKQNSPNTSQSLQVRPIDKVRQTSPNQSLRKRQALSRQASFTAVEIPTLEQQSPSMQTLVIKSSQKYFDSCRGQALNYIAKMQKMLFKQNKFLSESLMKINKYIQQQQNSMAEQLKQNLYRIVDESVQQWKMQEMSKFNKKQIDYIGELLQLNTQVEQRYKQIASYRADLDDDKFWKNRASDLLTSNYEADLLELSKMCKKSVEHSQDNVRQYLDITMRNASGKIIDKNSSGQLGQNICLLLSGDSIKVQQKCKSCQQSSAKQKTKEFTQKNKQQAKQLKTVRKQPIHQPLNKSTYLNPPVKIATLTPPINKPVQYSSAEYQNMRERRMTTICETCHRQVIQDDGAYGNRQGISNRQSYQQGGPMRRLPTFNSANQVKEQETASHLHVSRSSQLNAHHGNNDPNPVGHA